MVAPLAAPIIVHNPVPITGLLAAIVKLALLHLVRSGPVVAVVGGWFIVTTTLFVRSTSQSVVAFRAYTLIVVLAVRGSELITRSPPVPEKKPLKAALLASFRS